MYLDRDDSWLATASPWRAKLKTPQLVEIKLPFAALQRGLICCQSSLHYKAETGRPDRSR